MPCCSVTDCGRMTLARGLCGMHYQRQRQHGDPQEKASLKGESVERRFWSRVTKSDDCWTWTGPRTEDGYGRLWGIHCQVRAHRLSYEIHVGPIPDGLWVLHRCDNPPCVNPAHLFLGTVVENTADMHAKGRANLPARSGANHWTRKSPDRIARGQAMGRSHLTDAVVAEILTRFSAGGVTQRELARQYQVGHKNLNLILKRKTWKHVQPPQENA